MDSQSIATAAYIVASLLFILSPGRAVQARDRHARASCSASPAWRSRWSPRSSWSPTSADATAIVLLLVAVAIGAAIGLWRARVVEMTGMPELIALLHSFVGLAAVLVGWNGYLETRDVRRPADVAGHCWTSTTPRCSSASSSAR